jgi:hypothetical protein
MPWSEGMGSQGAGAGTAAPPRRSMSRIPNVRLDHRMACDLRSRDSVSAVADVKDVTGPDQPHRRRLTSLLEPRSVELDLRPVEVTGAEADVRQRNPCRCERRICDTPPFSRSVRVRTGGVEPPQPMATRLQRAELAGARRPQERCCGGDAFRDLPSQKVWIPAESVPPPRNPPRGKDRAAGRTRTDTAGITAPDARRYTTAAERRGNPWSPRKKTGGGSCFPQPEAET